MLSRRIVAISILVCLVAGCGSAGSSSRALTEASSPVVSDPPANVTSAGLLPELSPPTRSSGMLKVDKPAVVAQMFEEIDCDQFVAVGGVDIPDQSEQFAVPSMCVVALLAEPSYEIATRRPREGELVAVARIYTKLTFQELAKMTLFEMLDVVVYVEADVGPAGAVGFKSGETPDYVPEAADPNNPLGGRAPVMIGTQPGIAVRTTDHLLMITWEGPHSKDGWRVGMSMSGPGAPESVLLGAIDLQRKMG